MKRCNECGWSNNSTSSSKCEKCGASLDGSSKNEISETNTEPNFDSKKTVIGRKSDEKALDEHNPTLKNENLQEGICKSCQYPLRPGALVCPNCGTAVNSQKEEKKTLMFGDDGFDQIISDHYSVVLTDTKGEKLTIDLNDKAKTLGRNDLDENNKSISSSHAKLSVENGVLNIEDMSSNAMTFVQVKDKTELKDGDVIILGNQMYKLNFKNN